MAAEGAGAEKAELQSEFEEWLLTYEQAMTSLAAEERKLWQEVLGAAQPVVRRYQLQRLSDDYRPFGGPE